MCPRTCWLSRLAQLHREDHQRSPHLAWSREPKTLTEQEALRTHVLSGLNPEFLPCSLCGPLSKPRASEEIPSRSPSQPSWPSSPSSSAPPPSPGPPTAKQFEVEVQVCPREVPKGNQSAKHEVFRSVSSASTAHSTLVSDEGLATAAHAALVASEAMQEETAEHSARFRPLTISDAGQNLQNTFCNQCHLGVVSAGSASGSDEKNFLLEHVLKSIPYSQLRSQDTDATVWSYRTVNSPLVLLWEDKKKQDAVEGILSWYAQRGIAIPASKVFFFGDRTENIGPFASKGFNAREISCASRDTSKGGIVGYCGGTAAEIVETSGIQLCNAMQRPPWDQPVPDRPPVPAPPSNCLCVFDIDRTLTGKQGISGRWSACPANKKIDHIWDKAYSGGWLTLSEAGQNLEKTFCNSCYLGVVSAGSASGDGSAERRYLLKHVLKSEPFTKLQQREPQASSWSRRRRQVKSPLVLKWPDRLKQDAVQDIVTWYKKKGIKFAPERQLEEQSRRLEAQLASANQMLQPLLQSHQQVQQLLQQMRPPGPYPQGHSSPRIDIPVPGPYPVQPIQVPVTRRTIQVVRPPQVVSSVSVAPLQIASPRTFAPVTPSQAMPARQGHALSPIPPADSAAPVHEESSQALKPFQSSISIGVQTTAVEDTSAINQKNGISEVKEARDRLQEALAEGRAMSLSKDQLAAAERQRRRIHNLYQDMCNIALAFCSRGPLLLDLKGHLRIYCREMESLKVDGNILEAASLLEVARFPHSLRIFEVTLTGDTYEFDGIFDTSSSQEDIFDSSCDLAQSALDGHNVTVFCYGITGAGKTYTMYGAPEADGLAQRMISELFRKVDMNDARPQS
eukprot:g12487.t1